MDREVNFEHRLTEVEDRAKSNQHRLDEVEKRQNDQEKLISSVSVLATKLEAMDSDVKEIKKDVKEMTVKPGKRWDAVVEKVLLTVVSAVLLYILARLGF